MTTPWPELPDSNSGCGVVSALEVVEYLMKFHRAALTL